MKLHKLKSSLVAVAALLVGANPGSAWAADPAPAASPEYTLGFNVGVVTDYRYRGISQTARLGALQGGLDYAHKSGVYAGAWVSSIRWVGDAGGQSKQEVDVYAGYKGSLGAAAYDVGVLRYFYPANNLPTDASTTEWYAGIAHGAFAAKLSNSSTNLFGFANSKDSAYLDLSYTVDLGKGYTLVPHFGVQKIRNNIAAQYQDHSVALNKDFGKGLLGSATVVKTDADKTLYVTPTGRWTGAPALVLGLKYNF